MRSLFCMASDDISGGNKVFRHWMQLLANDGQDVSRFVWDKRRQFAGWSEIAVNDIEKIDDINGNRFDFVFFSNSFLVPLLLPHIGDAHPVLLAMAYESFHYGRSFEDAMQDKAAFLKILHLPISIMAVSKGVQKLLKDRAGVDSFYVPHGIESHFYRRPSPQLSETPKRILMVGSYLSPWKGMRNGFDALEKLSKELSVQLVIITQPTINRAIFDQYSFPIEFHCRPDLKEVPNIYASCHVHLCCSWHEGTGMPTMECMKCGVPVIATRNDGTDEFAQDGVNILLADRNSAEELYLQLKSLLTDGTLFEKLKTNGPKAMEFYSWENCFQLFKKAQEEIVQRSGHGAGKRCDNAAQRGIEQRQGAGSVDSAALDRLVCELESEGLYTSLETYAVLNEINATLRELCEQLVGNSIADQDAINTIKRLRAQTRAYISNERTESYSAFRAAYDFCGIILSLEGDEKFTKYAAAISRKKLAVTS